ncbi:MAG TPA: hypothetical protein VGK46_15070 [Saprospiraceae bacterium]
MHHLLLFLSLTLLLPTAKADYRYLSLSTLVCEADYGAIGTIVKLDENYFYLEVETYVLNQLDADTLKIQKFINWNCGRRYDLYTIGQKELVFFRKSNYVISDYDLLGYGGGGEFELPIRHDSIYYHYAYDKLKGYPLKSFLSALQDFASITQRTKVVSKTISPEEQKAFANLSPLHKVFIECRTLSTSDQPELPTNGYLTNLEKNHIYQDYENKIYLFDFDIDSVFLSVEDAEVWKQDGYFIVKPKDAWIRRWINVYAIHDTSQTNVLYNQLFEVLELPEPRIYFGTFYQDTTYSSYNSLPSVAHYLDYMHEDEFLDYELLSYNYTISSAGKTETYPMKSSAGTPELHKRISELKPGDHITISDVYVLYPNNTVKQISGRTVVVPKAE